MPELPQKKVGIIACSGEELPEGTITRQAALKVLEQLRPGDTVTICLPLFLAGGEGDRTFAKFYPTIAIDGCEKRCAYHGTETYSSKPAGSIVVSDLISQKGIGKPEGKRVLNAFGMQAVDAVADQVARQVDELLGKKRSQRKGKRAQLENRGEPKAEVPATCLCNSEIPSQKILLNGNEMTFVALPLIFKTFWESKKKPSDIVNKEIMNMVKIYNEIKPEQEAEVLRAISHEYALYCQKYEVRHE